MGDALEGREDACVHRRGDAVCGGEVQDPPVIGVGFDRTSVAKSGPDLVIHWKETDAGSPPEALALMDDLLLDHLEVEVEESLIEGDEEEGDSLEFTVTIPVGLLEQAVGDESGKLAYAIIQEIIASTADEDDEDDDEDDDDDF